MGPLPLPEKGCVRRGHRSQAGASRGPFHIQGCLSSCAPSPAEVLPQGPRGRGTLRPARVSPAQKGAGFGLMGGARFPKGDLGWGGGGH